jgi:membrane-associated phospholipid phosphatase
VTLRIASLPARLPTRLAMRPSTPWVALGAVALTGALAVVAVTTAHVGPVRHVDVTAFTSRPEITPRSATLGNDLLDTISTATMVGVTGVLVLLGLVAHRWRGALAPLVVVGGANVTAHYVKHSPLNGDRGFPSGHATVAMSVALAALVAAPAVLRPVLSALGALYATGVGLAVLLTGWHRPSDTIAAFLVAGAWAMVALLVDGRHRVHRAGVVAATALSAVAAGAGLAVAWWQDRTLTGPDDVTTPETAVGFGLVVATAVLVVGSVLAVSELRAPWRRAPRPVA